MSKPINFGVVGLSTSGWAAISILPSLRSPALSQNYRLTALCTTSASSAAQSAAKYSDDAHKVKAYHGSSEELARDPNVSFVIISVKVPAHSAAAIPVIKAGKDVFVEWPLGNGLEDAMRMAELARTAGVRTMVGMQSWQTPMVRKVKEWISAGEIGRVLSSAWLGTKPVEVPYWVPLAVERDAYTLDPKNGATLIEIALGHNLSAMIFALGPLTSLSATSAQMFDSTKIIDSTGQPTGKVVKTQTPDQIAFTGVLKDSGAISTAAWTSGVPTTTEGNHERPSFVWIIQGDLGFIRVEGTGRGGSAINVLPPQKVFLNGKEMPVMEGQDTVGNVGRAFGEFAKGPELGVYPTFEDAVVVHKHLEAVRKSVQSGERVSIEI